MNQVTVLCAELQIAEAELCALQDKYYFVKGFGTGWKGKHYGISQGEYDRAFQQNTILRGRVLRIMQDIERRKKPGRMRPSMVGLI